MSIDWDASTGIRELVGFRPRLRVATTIKRHWDAYIERRAHDRAVAQLRHWSDRQLKDIGISRSQIEFSVRHTENRRELR